MTLGEEYDGAHPVNSELVASPPTRKILKPEGLAVEFEMLLKEAWKFSVVLT